MKTSLRIDVIACDNVGCMQYYPQSTAYPKGWMKFRWLEVESSGYDFCSIYCLQQFLSTVAMVDHK